MTTMKQRLFHWQVFIVAVASILMNGCYAKAFTTHTTHITAVAASIPRRPIAEKSQPTAGQLKLEFQASSSQRNVHGEKTTNESLTDAVSGTSSREVTTTTTTTKTTSSTSTTLITAAATLSSVALAAKTGFLGTPYSNGMIVQDTAAALLTGVLGYLFVKLNTWLAQEHIVEPRDSRKFIHTFSAPLFMLFWPIFSPADGARFFAASVSFVNMVRLFLAGSGGDSSLAYAVSRSGDAKEALGGPFLYVVILQFAILFFWRTSPIGIVGLSAMAAGDGLADLIGRRFGKNNKWPFCPNKSVAGSLAFWVGGTACSFFLLHWLNIPISVSSLPLPPSLALTGIIGATAILELLPGVDDNWVVPLSAALLTMVFLT